MEQNMNLYLIRIMYGDKFTKFKYNTWKSSVVGHTSGECCLQVNVCEMHIQNTVSSVVMFVSNIRKKHNSTELTVTDT